MILCSADRHLLILTKLPKNYSQHQCSMLPPKQTKLHVITTMLGLPWRQWSMTICTKYTNLGLTAKPPCAQVCLSLPQGTFPPWPSAFGEEDFLRFPQKMNKKIH